MVDVQRLKWVTVKAVHGRIRRAAKRQGFKVIYSHGCYTLVSPEWSHVVFDFDQAVSMLEVIKPWERVCGYTLRARPFQ